MSVYIKGMEMPHFEHQELDIRQGTDGKWYVIDGKWYEIIPVLDHGRLIDADALEELCVKLNAENWGITRGDYKMLDAVIFEFPTIIPADMEADNE